MSVGESVVGNLIAKLTLDTVGFFTGADSAIKKIGALSAALTGVGAVSTKAAKTVVKSATDFETAFTGVRKTVDAPIGTDAEEFFSNLRQEIIDMSTELPTAATEIAGVYQAAGQLGIEAQNLTGFSRAMIKLASATNLSSDEAATSLAQFANVMQTDQTQFENMGSSIVALGNNFATNERQIVNFAQEMSIAGKLAGMSEADIIGLGTALASMGLEANSSGTAFQRFSQRVTNAVAKGNSDLKIFADTAGVTAEEFAKAWSEDSTGAFITFLEGLGNMTSAEQLGVLDSLEIGQQREITVLQSLAANTDLVTEAINMSNTAWQENTALSKEADTANSTTAAQMQLFSNNLSELAITIGTNLLPVINELLNTIKPIVENITQWAAEHPKLTTAIILTGVALGVIGGIMTTLLPIITAISGAGGIAAIAGALGGVLAAAMPVIAVIAVLAVAFLALKTAIENNFLGLGDKFEELKTHLAGVVESVKSYWADLKAEYEENGIEGALVMLGEDAMTAIGTGIQTALDTVWVLIQEALQGADGLATKIRQFFSDFDWGGALLTFANKLKTTLSEKMNLVKNAFVGEDGFGGKIKKWIDEIDLMSIGSNIIHKIGQGIMNAINAMKASIQSAIMSLIPDFALGWFGLGEGSSSGAGAVVGNPTDMFKSSGGPVHGNQAYIVGEAGPELFVPNSSGTIIPNDVFSNYGQSVVVNFNGDVIGDEQSIYSLVNRAVKAGIRQEVRAAS